MQVEDLDAGNIQGIGFEHMFLKTLKYHVLISYGSTYKNYLP